MNCGGNGPKDEDDELDLDFFLEDLISEFNSNDIDLPVASNDSPDYIITTNDIDIDLGPDLKSNDIEDILPEPVPEPEPEPVPEPKPVPEPVPVIPPDPIVPADDCKLDDGCLTSIADVRRFVLDRMIDDNEIDLELFFGDDEIITARRLAVAYYNEVPPYVDRISLSDCNQDCLPAPVMFLNGIAYQLYLAKLQKLHKEDVDYQAGGMTVNIIKKRIAYITSTIKEFKTEFENLATSRKTHINYLSAFGRVG